MQSQIPSTEGGVTRWGSHGGQSQLYYLEEEELHAESRRKGKIW